MSLQPTETVQATPSAQMTGSSAGELYGATIRDLQTLKEQSGGNLVQVRKSLLLRLQKNELITSSDIERLQRAGDILDAQEVPEAAAQVRSLYQAMLTDNSSSQAALAIISIAVDSSVTSALQNVALSKGGEQLAREWGVSFASSSHGRGHVLDGAIAGAVIGGTFGGAAGALVGAAIGGLAGFIDSLLQ